MPGILPLRFQVRAIGLPKFAGEVSPDSLVQVTPLRAAIALFCLVLSCHGILPFTDYVNYDDRYMVNWVSQGRLDDLKIIYSMTGLGFVYPYFAAFSGIPHLVAVFKVFGVILAWATGWLIYRIGIASGFLTHPESLLVSVVAVALPIFKFKGGFVYSLYEWTLAAFLMATLIALQGETRTGWAHRVRRVVALALFTLSFFMQSLLMFYGGFFLLMIIVHQRQTGKRWYQLPVRFCLTHLDYLLLPYGFLTAKTFFFRPWGLYASYNQINPSWERLKATGLAIPEVIADPIMLTMGFPKPLIIGLCLASIVTWRLTRIWFRPRNDQVTQSVTATRWSAIPILLFGLLLLLFGTFPYAAVGKTPGAFGVPSSYAPLIALPFAVVLLGLVRAMTGLAPKPARVVMPIVLTLLMFCCVAGWWHNALSLQALEARNRAVVQQLRNNPEVRDSTVYCFLNQCQIARTPDYLFGWEWVYIDAGTWGRPRSFAYNGLPNTQTTPAWYVRECLSTIPVGNDLAGIDEHGSQAVVLVRPGTELTPPELGWKYLWINYRHPQKLEQFLNRIVQMQVFPAPINPAEVRRKVNLPEQ